MSDVNMLEDGSLLLQLKMCFLEDASENNLFYFLGALRNTNVVLPLEMKNGKKNPDVLQGDGKNFVPIFSNQSQLPEGYGGGSVREAIPMDEAVALAKAQSDVIGFVLDPFTDPVELTYDLIDAMMAMKRL